MKSVAFGMSRQALARDMRVSAAEWHYQQPDPVHVSTGEEGAYPTYLANYSKGLPHDDRGEVDPAAYQQLVRAVTSGDPAEFERIPLDPRGGRKLVNPQAGFSFDLQGHDSQALTLPPPPRIDSAETAGEMAELYWMALCRDVPFTRFEENERVNAAAADLSGFSDFRGPKEGGRVTPRLLFRGFTPGDAVGPYVSQFLLRDVQYGTMRFRQVHDTVQPGRDYVTTFDTWLAVQRGVPRALAPADRNTRDLRLLRTPRDMAHYVHFDELYQAFLNACLILLHMRAPVDSGNPYAWSRNQEGFGTFGGPHILTLVTEVATRAVKTVWYQKWAVHRRLRPEAFGGRVDNHLSGRRPLDGVIHEDLLNSRALEETRAATGSAFLPQAFPEGSPLHPSYGAGHATVAGACTTILKAWFEEGTPITDPVQPDDEGTALRPYTGPDAGDLTVGGELDKLAANIASARNMAGVHWRSDYSQSARLGETVAIGLLREQKLVANETLSFSLTRFDGTRMTI